MIENVFHSKCTLEINGIAVAEAVGEDKKISRTMASDLAMKKLRKVCYIIKVEHYYVNRAIYTVFTIKIFKL